MLLVKYQTCSEIVDLQITRREITNGHLVIDTETETEGQGRNLPWVSTWSELEVVCEFRRLIFVFSAYRWGARGECSVWWKWFCGKGSPWSEVIYLKCRKHIAGIGICLGVEMR
jgi:hypothetical protein